MITERTMAIRKSPSYRLFLFSAVGMLLVALWASRADAQCVGVTISPGDDIQEKLTANPTGTTFCFKSGLYRIISPISPKNNQILMSAAAPGAVLDGSKVVTRFQTSGLNWVATGFLPRLRADFHDRGVQHAFCRRLRQCRNFDWCNPSRWIVG